jgi:hypothetical protein
VWTTCLATERRFGEDAADTSDQVLVRARPERSAPRRPRSSIGGEAVPVAPDVDLVWGRSRRRQRRAEPYGHRPLGRKGGGTRPGRLSRGDSGARSQGSGTRDQPDRSAGLPADSRPPGSGPLDQVSLFVTPPL